MVNLIFSFHTTQQHFRVKGSFTGEIEFVACKSQFDIRWFFIIYFFKVEEGKQAGLIILSFPILINSSNNISS